MAIRKDQAASPGRAGGCRQALRCWSKATKHLDMKGLVRASLRQGGVVEATLGPHRGSRLHPTCDRAGGPDGTGYSKSRDFNHSWASSRFQGSTSQGLAVPSLFLSHQPDDLARPGLLWRQDSSRRRIHCSRCIPQFIAHDAFLSEWSHLLFSLLAILPQALVHSFI